MTVSADYAAEVAALRGITHVLNGSRFLIRTALKLGAASLALVALFVWLAPGASWESDLMLFKLALSIAAVFGAVAMWHGSRPVGAPTVEIDVANMELLLIREAPSEPHRIIERCAFVDLHAVDVYGHRVTFWGKGDRLLAEISLSNPTAHNALLGALRGLGKLA